MSQCHISTQKINFLREATLLYEETTCLHEEGVVLIGQRRFHHLNDFVHVSTPDRSQISKVQFGSKLTQIPRKPGLKFFNVTSSQDVLSDALARRTKIYSYELIIVFVWCLHKRPQMDVSMTTTTMQFSEILL